MSGGEVYRRDWMVTPLQSRLANRGYWALIAMHETADHFVQHLFDLYGPLAVFGLLVIAGVGLHLPEDLIVIPAGWEIAARRVPDVLDGARRLPRRHRR